MNRPIEMIVLDMAGTTVLDKNEVEHCFVEAAEKTGLNVNRERIISMMGWSKILVFETLWREKSLTEKEEVLQRKIMQSYNTFREILENHYEISEIHPTPGCIALLNFLKDHKIKIVLNTGFYRKVTDIILKKLCWHGSQGLIDYTVCSDEVLLGRPAPYMIFRAMEHLRVTDVRNVIKIGDTPSDLAEGKNAGCLRSFGITNGTHPREQLEHFENDGLFDDLFLFKKYLSDMLAFD
jgi:phosphonatase-like hydrolase